VESFEPCHDSFFFNLSTNNWHFISPETSPPKLITMSLLSSESGNPSDVSMEVS